MHHKELGISRAPALLGLGDLCKNQLPLTKIHYMSVDRCLPKGMVTDPGITTGGDYAQASPKARDGVRGTVTGRVCIFSDFPSLSPLLLVPSHTGILVLLIVSWAGVVGIWGLKNLRQGACHWNKKCREGYIVIVKGGIYSQVYCNIICHLSFGCIPYT